MIPKGEFAPPACWTGYQAGL